LDRSDDFCFFANGDKESLVRMCCLQPAVVNVRKLFSPVKQTKVSVAVFLNGPNMLEFYIALGWKGLLATHSVAFWTNL